MAASTRTLGRRPAQVLHLPLLPAHLPRRISNEGRVAVGYALAFFSNNVRTKRLITFRSHIIHDLQPYHCTYEDCSDANRLYGSHQEWLDHENQHTNVWHCNSHACEFPTSLEYVQHLRQAHPDAGPEHCSPELVSAAVGPSIMVHRGCPLCPMDFDDVSEMQKHLRHHLERLALFSLPAEGDEEDEVDTGNSSDSHQVIQGRGRAASLEQDFDDDDGPNFPWPVPPIEGGSGTKETYTPADLAILRQKNPSRPAGESESDFVRRWMEKLAAAAESNDMDGGNVTPTENRSKYR